MDFDELIADAIEKNPKAVRQFKEGKEKALNAVMGYILKQEKIYPPQLILDTLRLELGVEARKKVKKPKIEPVERKVHYTFGLFPVDVKKGGITKYWAEHEDIRIEFDILDIADKEKWAQYDLQFHSLFEYIKNQLIPSYLTDAEYQAIVSRRTEAEKKDIENRIRSGGR
jgi:hypothetical protein